MKKRYIPIARVGNFLFQTQPSLILPYLSEEKRKVKKNINKI